MEYITSEQLSEMPRIGIGNFGTIYKSGNKAIKIYNSEVKTDFHGLMKNPVLKHLILTRIKCNRLIELNNNINNTDLIEDLVYVDNHFRGVVLPYYDGKLFLDCLNYPLDKRIDYSKKLVQNARELTDNNIYTFDYKLTNMLVYNGEVKIIDLDDPFTKVTFIKDVFMQRRSVLILDETIKVFLKENFNGVYSPGVNELLNKKHYHPNDTYDGIEKYLEEKSIKKSILFIDDNSDISNSDFNNFDIVYTFDRFNEKEVIDKINYLKSRNIIVNNLITKKKIDEYINNSISDECLFAGNKKVLRLK